MESEAVISGEAGRSGGKPPLPNAKGLENALALPPKWIVVNKNDDSSALVVANKRIKYNDDNDNDDDEEGSNALVKFDGSDGEYPQDKVTGWEARAKEVSLHTYTDIYICMLLYMYICS